MTGPQWLSILTLAGMMALFVWDRFRYDVSAGIALLAAVALGVVKPADAFSGFSDDIVVIVGSALVISAAVQRSGKVELLLSLLAGRVRSAQSELVLLTGTVGFASALVKNVGALSMLMPAAVQMARRRGASPSLFLMPMSFASLLGGLMTLVGTSPNIIVSRVRMEMTGKPFGMFDYLPTGLGLLLVGLVFLRFSARFIPAGRAAAPQVAEALDVGAYITEASIPAGSAAAGETTRAFARRHGGELAIVGLVRNGTRGAVHPFARLREGDALILEGPPDVLHQAIARDRLTLKGKDRRVPEGSERDEIVVVEAVVTRGSVLVGKAAGRYFLHQRYGVNLIAISRAGERLDRKLAEIVLRAGDVVVLQGPGGILPQRLKDLGTLPLAERPIRLGQRSRGWLPLAILAAAMAATASGTVPVAIAFFAAAGAVVVAGTLPVRAAYEAIDWSILIMLGALIPVSDSLRTSGASQVLASGLAQLGALLPPWAAVGLILVAAMAVTPFLNNAATVLVVAPISAVFAHDLGYRPEAFLIATAVGAGCDFLTPIGHQCNTLVFGPGGYRFSDYARLGAPLSALVLLVGTPLILLVWPVR
ncbi:SLC13 family permease [Novosphingobium bradum]|uniref:SLC13 family permease n=1 Tax=Novosphingobium bradum TaxID=1737444 RepID=A0ABV7IVA8_9SPHN